MHHSVTFQMAIEGYKKNTWDDWGLIPSSRPVINPPKRKEKIIEIPGRDGYLDLSTALTGYLVYENRTGQMEFLVRKDYPKEWTDLYSEILFFLNGRKTLVVLEDDPLWHYIGSVSLNEWESKSDGTGSKIVIDYDLEPYKRYYKQSSIGNTEFDSLEVRSGPIYEQLCRFSLPIDYNYQGSEGKMVVASAFRDNMAGIIPGKKSIPWNTYCHEEMPQVLEIITTNMTSGYDLHVEFYSNVRRTSMQNTWERDLIQNNIYTNGVHLLSDMVLGPFSEIYFQMRSGTTGSDSASANITINFIPGRL